MKHLFSIVILLIYPISVTANECVILLHGLARTADSMNKISQSLADNQFVVTNVDYPSRENNIEDLADNTIPKALEQCKSKSATPVNFVTHSLGGILVRQYLKKHQLPELKRVVMLGPPNAGSELVDILGDLLFYQAINGPAGSQLGTELTDLPKKLGPVNFELGVIAGTKSINPVFSALLPIPNDGKVSVESAKIEGMCSFLTLPLTHTFMMKNKEAIQQVLNFLKNGAFSGESSVSIPCSRSRYISYRAIDITHPESTEYCVGTTRRKANQCSQRVYKSNTG